MRGGTKNNVWIKVEREAAWKEQDCRCAYCLSRLRRAEVTADHIKPKASGGTDHKNISAACQSCNLTKGKTPVSIFRKMISKRAAYTNPNVETIRIIRSLNIETDRSCKRILLAVGIKQ